MFSKSSEYNVLAEGMYFLDKSSPSNFNFLEFPLLVWSCPNSSSRLFKSFEFGNGSRMSDKKLVILEFKYLQNKKWKKQAVKRTRRKKSYKTYWTIYLDNRKACNFSSKIVNFQHLLRFRSIREAPWMQIFLFLQPIWHQERTGLSDSRTFQPQWG